MTADRNFVWGGVIVAAGSSQRFGSGDKIVMPLLGYPVICWSVGLIAANSRIREIVVVTATENRKAIEDAILHRYPDLNARFCSGGGTRSSSVRAGLDALSSTVTHVAIHDGARPLATAALVHELIDATERNGAAVPAVQPTNSIGVRSTDRDNLAGSLDRSRLVELQTPQGARLSALVDALKRFPDETDESSALFKAGYDVALVSGERSNIKITRAEDLAIASALAATLEGGE